jgi:hypothetical protein
MKCDRREERKIGQVEKSVEKLMMRKFERDTKTFLYIYVR